mgnify:CR=1 FL=1
MVLPDKYTEPNNSLFYLGSYILKIVASKKMELAEIWIKFKKETSNTVSYNRFLQTLIYLYSIGSITYTEEGEIYNENIKYWNIFPKSWIVTWG